MRGGLSALLLLEPPVGTTIVSFDIFDTIVQRRIDPPEKVKEWACRAFLRSYPLDDTEKNFLSQRRHIEQLIQAERRSKGLDPEIAIVEVAERLRLLYTKSPDFKKQFLQAELTAEKSLILPALELVPLLERLSSRYRLIAVSDTYLSEPMLRELLEFTDLSRFFSSVYSSCDHGVSKGSGRLFTVVANQEGVKFNQLFHIGDNFLSDYFRPQSIGISSFLYIDKQNRKRRQLLSSVACREHDNFWKSYSFLLRLSEGARLPVPEQSLRYHWGRRVVGPLLACFTHQLVRDLEESGDTALFFVAREGFMLKKLYELFAPLGHKKNMPRYLCISRYTAFRAALSNPGGWAAAIASVGFLPSLHDAFRRFGFEDGEITTVLERFGVSGELQSGKDVREVLLRLLEIPEFVELVRERSIQVRHNLEQYLTEQGFFAAKRVVLVDTGWYGTIQDLLESCFSGRQDMPEMNGAYLALKRSCTGSSAERKRGVLHDFRRPAPELETLTFFRESFEISCRALHGTTAGYSENENGKMLPLFKMDEGERSMNAGIREIQQGILDCARDYLRLQSMDPIDPDLLAPVAASIYDQQIGFPSPALARTFDGLCNSDDFGTDRMKPLVAPLSVSDFADLWTFQRLLITTPWREASLRKCGVPGLLWLFNGARRLLAWKRIKDSQS